MKNRRAFTTHLKVGEGGRNAGRKGGPCFRNLGELGGGNSNIFLDPPLPGEMIQFDEHIFQTGWFNHQLENFHGFKSLLAMLFVSARRYSYLLKLRHHMLKLGKTPVVVSRIFCMYY